MDAADELAAYSWMGGDLEIPRRGVATEVRAGRGEGGDD